MASSTFQSTKDKGTQAFDKTKEAGAEALERTKDAGAEAFGKAKECGTDVLGKTKEAASAVGDMATETASAMGRQADDMAATAGHQIREFGENISRRAPHEGLAGQASQVVADTIKSSGRYLEETKLSGMAQDVGQVVKNHPIPALLVCFGVGYCLGRAMKD